MIGRDRELRLLAQLAASNRRHLVMLAGEPGIGKTRLVRELIAQLPPQTTVLVGHAEPDSLARPFELLLDAVTTAGDGTAGDGTAAMAAELQALSDPARSPVERLHTGLMIASRLAGDGPAVIVFEDLHWVDSDSAALFERLADQPPPRLLIGTYRPDEITSRHPVASLLSRLERRHELTHLRLERFSVDETAAMLAAVAGTPVPYRVAAAIAHRTGGNPFFLEELLRGFDVGDLAALSERPLPWSLAEVLRRQVADLDPRHRVIVETAAVLGNRIPFDLLAAATGEAEEPLISTLRDLVAGGVLVEEREDEFSFRHALVREAISGQMLGRQRRRVHQAALEKLLAAGEADPALVAYHARAAGRYEEMVAAARRGAAAYLAIGSAYQALQLAELGLAEAGDEVPLLSTAAHAAWLAGLLEDAAGYAERWRNTAVEPSDQADALDLLIRLAGDADDIPRLTAYAAEVERLLASLPDGDARARAMTAVARSHLNRSDPHEAAQWADRGIGGPRPPVAPGTPGR
jgi:ATP/maltotriose-dependent transcriptional regulator MalT